jgi:hypothetical protein
MMATKVSEATIERARLLMADGVERNYHDIYDELNIGKQAGLVLSKILHQRALIRITSWEFAPRNGHICPRYTIGGGNDVPSPADSSIDRSTLRFREEREWLSESRESGQCAFRDWRDVALFGEYQRSGI